MVLANPINNAQDFRFNPLWPARHPPSVHLSLQEEQQDYKKPLIHMFAFCTVSLEPKLWFQGQNSTLQFGPENCGTLCAYTVCICE